VVPAPPAPGDAGASPCGGPGRSRGARSVLVWQWPRHSHDPSPASRTTPRLCGLQCVTSTESETRPAQALCCTRNRDTDLDATRTQAGYTIAAKGEEHACTRKAALDAGDARGSARCLPRGPRASGGRCRHRRAPRLPLLRARHLLRPQRPGDPRRVRLRCGPGDEPGMGGCRSLVPADDESGRRDESEPGSQALRRRRQRGHALRPRLRLRRRQFEPAHRQNRYYEVLAATARRRAARCGRNGARTSPISRRTPSPSS
jgi:hypothetical protein